MPKDYIEQYIQEAKGRGKTDAEIRVALSTHPGVTEADIREAFGEFTQAQSVVAGEVAPLPIAAEQISTELTPVYSPSPPLATGGSIAPSSHPLAESLGTMPTPPPRRSMGKLLGIVVAVILLLAIAGVAAAQYTGTYSLSWLPVSSERVWNKFKGQSKHEPVSTEYSFGYFDAGADGIESPFGGVLKNIKVEVKGNAYANGSSELKDLRSQSTVTYSLASGNTSFSTGIEYRLVGDTFYLNIGQNPFLSGLMNLGADGEGAKKYDWIKISLNPDTLKKLENAEGGTSDIGQIVDQRYWQGLSESWKKEEFLEKPKYVGKDTVRGMPTLRYRTNIKKDVVKKVASQFVDKILESQTKETKDTTKSFINGLVDKLEIQDMEIWVGQRDAQVRKVVVRSNAPSVASFAKAAEDQSKLEMEAYTKACSDYTKPCDPPPSPSTQESIKKILDALQFSAQFNLSFEFFDYGKTQAVTVPDKVYDITTAFDDARKASRDAKRIADVRQMATGLELYFNDNNKYPAKLADLSPAYMGAVPTAPEPPDGSCNATQNSYAYAALVGAGQNDYALTFCVGKEVGGYTAGAHTLSASGIK